MTNKDAINNNSTSAGGAAEGSQGKAALRTVPRSVPQTQPRPERAGKRHQVWRLSESLALQFYISTPSGLARFFTPFQSGFL